MKTFAISLTLAGRFASVSAYAHEANKPVAASPARHSYLM